MPRLSRKEPILIRLQRARYTSKAVLIDDNLDCHSLDELRQWAARKIDFVVIDPETGDDITRILLA